MLRSSSMWMRSTVSSWPSGWRIVRLLAVSTAIMPVSTRPVGRDQDIAEELRHHLAVRVEDVEQHGVEPAVADRREVGADLLADAFEAVAGRALGLEDLLAAPRVALQLEGLLIGGDHVLAPGLRGGEEAAGAGPTAASGYDLSSSSRAGSRSARAIVPFSTASRKALTQAGPREEGLGGRRAELRAHPGQPRSRIAGHARVVEAGQGLDGLRLHGRRLPRGQELGQRPLDVGQAGEPQRTGPRRPARPPACCSSIAVVRASASSAVEDRPDPAATCAGQPRPRRGGISSIKARTMPRARPARRPAGRPATRGSRPGRRDGPPRRSARPGPSGRHARAPRCGSRRRRPGA